MGWTILRNCWYTDFLVPGLAGAVASGKLVSATGQGGAPYVTREDCAQAAAAALASPETGNQTWNITGPDLVTYAELAKLASELTGRPVSFDPVTPDERVQQLIAAGTPEFIAKLLVSSQMAIEQGKMGTPTTAVKEADRPGTDERSRVFIGASSRDCCRRRSRRGIERLSQITYRAEGAVARIELNRPERRNALDQEMLTEFRDALRDSESDANVRVVVVTGAGKDFCSGMDLRVFGNDVSDDVARFQAEARNMAGLLLDMRRHPRPIVAAVQGRALGGGCGIATAADIVLATDTAQFGYPEINIGYVAAIVVAILRRLVSEKRAFELMTSGDVIPAKTALEYGMINRVFGVDNFDREVEEFAARLASKSTSALTMSKQLFYRTDAMEFEAAIEAGVEINAFARTTEDFKRGIEKFLKKT